MALMNNKFFTYNLLTLNYIKKKPKKIQNASLNLIITNINSQKVYNLRANPYTKLK